MRGEIETHKFFQQAEEEWCVRMFLSVDVSGSTEYKNKNLGFSDFTRHWARFYKSFFEEFPLKFELACHHQFQKSRRTPEIWKCLGDEIIYQDRVADPKECHQLATAFCHALAFYDEELRHGKFRESGLRVKGTCWTAAFPVRNSILPVPGPNKKLVQDYVGPDMDIGFRLSKASRPGRVVISMDLADILTQIDPVDPFNFHHVGWEVFKGVFGDKPYPIFWVTKGDRPPHMLPWEGHICAFSQRFLQSSGTASSKLRQMIANMRQELPQMELFSPYFTLETMPPAHQKIWEVWNSHRRKHTEIDLDQGADSHARSL